MTIDEIRSVLVDGQSHGGAFLSISDWGERSYQDWNGFTTALVLRALGRLPESILPADVCEKALNFLFTCESPDRPGAFGFWPKAARPSWIREELPEDADDTSVCALELARYGRLDREAVCRIACTTLVPYRLHKIGAPAPPWLKPGVFLTWLRNGDSSNVVDCCVNANVLALLAYAGLEHLPGFREACAMIDDAVRWAGNSPVRARSLVPFYPNPIELRCALENAVRCGAKLLDSTLLFLRDFPWANEDEQDEAFIARPLFGSAYGSVVWTSRVLQTVRLASRSSA